MCETQKKKLDKESIDEVDPIFENNWLHKVSDINTDCNT